MTQQELLAQLKSLHVPTAISMWPQSILYILLLLILLFCFFVAYKLFWNDKHQRQKKALILLSDAVQLYDTAPAPAIANISILLRRIALATHNPRDVAGLSNIEWLNFLDNQIQTKEFSQGVGQVLLTAPYQKTVTVDIASLERLVKLWIKKVL